MMICHDPPIVFVHIPKTAGTSIAQMLEPFSSKAADTRWRRILRKLRVRQDPLSAHFRSHDGAAQVKYAFGAQTYARYDVFSVVRNPFDHAVSHYTSLCEFHRRSASTALSQMDFVTYLRNRVSPSPAYPRSPFARMSDQFSFLSDRQGTLIVPTVLRFESISDTLPKFLSEKGIETPALPHARPTNSRQMPLANYYTPEAIDLVRRVYRRDFTAFDYGLDVPDS